MPLNYSLGITADDVNASPASNKMQNWDRNKRLAHALCQGMIESDFCADVIQLVMSDPMALVRAVEPVLDVYSSICHTTDEDGTTIYNEQVVKPFRAALPERFKAMTEALITTIEVDPRDAAEMSHALSKVVNFSSQGRGQTAQSKQDASKSASQIEELVKNGIFFSPQLFTSFQTKNGDRIQAAVNFWGRTPGKENLIVELNKLLPNTKKYTPIITAGGVRRDPNSHNVDYMLLVALFINNLAIKITPPNSESMSSYLPRYLAAIKKPMSEMIAKQNIGVSMYTGLSEANIPKGSDPRSIGPQALTSKRLTNAMIPIFMHYGEDGYESSPEAFSRLAYHEATFLAICKVVLMCDANSPDYRSKMIQFSRWTRNQLLNKQGFRCPNFMKFDPFKVRVVPKSSMAVFTTGNPGPGPDGGFGATDISHMIAPLFPRRPTKEEIAAAKEITELAPGTDSMEARQMWWSLANGNGYDKATKKMVPDPDLRLPTVSAINAWYDKRYRSDKPRSLEFIEVEVSDISGEHTIRIPAKMEKSNECIYGDALWKKKGDKKWERSFDKSSMDLFRSQTEDSGNEFQA